MHPKVEAYLAEKETVRKAAHQAEKQRFLEKEGIFEFVPNPIQKDGYTSEFPDCEPDPNTGEYVYGKKTPVEITDEEYELLRAVSGVESTHNRNKVASILQGIAYAIYILAGLAAFIMLLSGDEYLLIPTLITLFSGLISGTSFLGFAEIIKLLHEIKGKLK